MTNDTRQGAINKARKQFREMGHVDRNLMVALFDACDEQQKIIEEKDAHIATLNRRLVSKTWGNSEASPGARVAGHRVNTKRAS